MRTLQLIDSLRSGGAERMAVNYANALSKRIDKSLICCTREEGLLKSQLSPNVGFLFLNKKSKLDFKAFFKLRKFVKEKKINLIQAHSSSWFLALMVKMSLPKVKLIWHDHYGRDLIKRKPGMLRPASLFFDRVISVNQNLEKWSKINLKCQNIKYFPNFLPIKTESVLYENSSPLLGDQDDFKILCLANLRMQKDHLNLLKSFGKLLKIEKKFSLHLVGKDFNDNYSRNLKKYISRHKLDNKVFFYGEQENVELFLEQADLGVLASISEGLPVALLEYGRACLPVVCTSVGECPAVIGKNGLLVPPKNSKALAEAVKIYFDRRDLLQRDARNFQDVVLAQYSEDFVIPNVLHFFTQTYFKSIQED